MNMETSVEPSAGPESVAGTDELQAHALLLSPGCQLYAIVFQKFGAAVCTENLIHFHLVTITPGKIVRLSCAKCGRAGQYRKQILIERCGPDVRLPDLREEIAQCSRRGMHVAWWVKFI
jgi:hypothetical protein